MNRKISFISAGLFSLASSALPAIAGDWNNGAGSLKDRGNAAVPVPAPVPLYDGPSGWYLRLDVGIGREASRNSTEKGIAYGAGNGTDSYSASGAGFGSSSGWSDTGADSNFGYGAGVGYTWSSHWRSDLTLDRRSSTDYKMRGTYQYNNLVLNPTAPFTPTYVPPTAPATPAQINGVVTDSTTVQSGVLMANTYYDWKNRSAFTPYVGAGLGLAYMDLARKYVASDTSCDPSALPIPCPTYSAHRSFAASGTETRLLWAAAAHAGFSYALTPVTSLDFNYRLLYIPSANIDLKVNGYQSRLSLNDITEHQLRAGLRWNIN